MKLPLNLIKLSHTDIYDQLRLEEALLRTDEGNWCLINQGSPDAIVMGISGRYDDLIERPLHLQRPIPVIRRFSGGGTVVVDSETLFVSFIFNACDHPFPAFPEPIMRWSIDLYQKSWRLAGLDLRENDYVIGSKKCGGNAQYIKKQRWLHHTTFLWNYDPSKMALLKLPQRRPHYRDNRHHSDFLTPLSHHAPDLKGLIIHLESELSNRYHIQNRDWESLTSYLTRDYRCSTQLISS